jgi:hypothetical protein
LQVWRDRTNQQQRLVDESDTLVADAIDLGTLKRHQDRIRGGMANSNCRIIERRARIKTEKSLRLLINFQRLTPAPIPTATAAEPVLHLLHRINEDKR